MRDRLIELLENSLAKYNVPENIADELLADGWIRPPCKVGEDVWCIVEGIKEVMRGKVRRFTVGEDYINVYVGIDGYFEQVYNAKEFGVKIFRCKEEAETALKERDVR